MHFPGQLFFELQTVIRQNYVNNITSFDRTQIYDRLTSRNHRNQKDLRAIRYGDPVKIAPGYVAVVDAYHGIRVAVIDGLQHIGDCHSLMPGDGAIRDFNHDCTPLAFRSSKTSGKSMPRLLTFATVGMPSAVQPRRW